MKEFVVAVISLQFSRIGMFWFPSETLGGLHKSARKVINKIASLAQDNLSICCYTTIRQSLLDSVAIGVQRATESL